VLTFARCSTHRRDRPLSGDTTPSHLKFFAPGPETISVDRKWSGAGVLEYGATWNARALPITTFELIPAGLAGGLLYGY
ncbi:MAG TPA: hypothetical protein VM715_13840, partial [Candidatus Acidoferrum sp.]|nr:hypothetical protein [Candidatus Acidoferrum sp.]